MINDMNKINDFAQNTYNHIILFYFNQIHPNLDEKNTQRHKT